MQGYRWRSNLRLWRLVSDRSSVRVRPPAPHGLALRRPLRHLARPPPRRPLGAFAAFRTIPGRFAPPTPLYGGRDPVEGGVRMAVIRMGVKAVGRLGLYRGPDQIRRPRTDGAALGRICVGGPPP